MGNNYSLKHRAFVILGLVNEKMHEGGCHPYDINKRIEERGMRDWTNIGINFSLSTIYRKLELLEKKDLLESFEEEIDGRIRKNYRITSYGYEILRNKVYEVLYNYIGKKDEDFYVAFSMFPILIPEEQIEVFNHSLEAIKKHKQELEKMLADMLVNFPKMPINVTGLFQHPIKILETDIEFFKMVLEKIKEGHNHFELDAYEQKKVK
jgi:DNA-binding PadR family transcriptional regulator